MVDRTRKEFSETDIARIAGIYHSWRGVVDAGAYEAEPGFCKVATLSEIRAHNDVLTPGRYVGVATQADDGLPFEERFADLKETLAEQFAEAEELCALIQRKIDAVKI